MEKHNTDITDLAERLITGDRTALSRGITLLESDKAEHARMASELMARILPHRGRTIRIGITGTPGVGKSTFIESFGLHLVREQGLKVAVLAIDPTSARSKGSILGDKTRMAELSAMDEVYIRPSPSKGSLGGVAAATMESVYLLEAAGFDVVIIETVGVGQSETAVHDMVDFFLLLIQPGSGDQLQGIKRGIMEMADAIVVNKADGNLLSKAEETAREYKMAIQLLPSARAQWRTRITHCSALEGQHMDKIWAMVQEFSSVMHESGDFERNRKKQELRWFDHALREGLVQEVQQNEQWNEDARETRDKISSGELTAFQGAELLLSRIRIGLGPET